MALDQNLELLNILTRSKNPKLGPSEYKTTSIKLDAELYEGFKSFAASRNVSFSQLVDAAILKKFS